MVQFMKSGNFRPEPGTTPSRDKVPVKVEIEDSLEEEHGPYIKRSKPSPNFQQWGAGTNAFPIPPSQYNPLDEPSPLGLRLRKSPSLLDLIQMKLSQGQASTLGAASGENSNPGHKKDAKGAAGSSIDKLKASNFAASLLRIGSWEYASRYEGDLVAKCYFAKHKLVWEVLDGGLKSKIEIQWSDIMGLKATCPDNGPGTLKVLLARQPLFFRETNPQPRKHTLWQATADFTDGQASIHRLHFLQCPQGLLNKHFEKLIQCDMRLNFLSQQPEIVLESPFFEPRGSLFAEPSESKIHGFDHSEIGIGPSPTISGFQDVASPLSSQSSTLKIEQHDRVGRVLEQLSREAPSPSSVMDSCAIEGNGSGEVDNLKMVRTRNWEQLKVPGFHHSMSVSDLVSHIGHCISEQKTSGNPTFDEDLECRDVLEDIAQYLLSDSQFTSASDEKCIMSRVNSLCCLLQKDPIQNLQASGEGLNDGKDFQLNHTLDSMHDNKIRGDIVPPEGDSKDVSGFKHAPAMSRKDSFGELLLHLPRIASLPKFLFNISEDGEHHAR